MVLPCEHEPEGEEQAESADRSTRRSDEWNCHCECTTEWQQSR